MNPRIDVSGRWVNEFTWYENGKRGGVIREAVALTQKGSKVEMTVESETTSPSVIEGTLQGNVFTIHGSWSYESRDGSDVGTTTVTSMKVTFSKDGKSASSEDTWRWQNKYDPSEVTHGHSVGVWSRI